MTALYRYPKTKHVRVLQPKKFKSYNPYKRLLRFEFNGICVYCRLPDLSNGPRGFWKYVVEHYLPKGNPAFAHLECEYSNLFYACEGCNAFKGEKWWPNFIPNPCDDVMHEHLQFADAKVHARSTRGEEAIELLHLNEDRVVLFREKAAQNFLLSAKHVREMDQTISRLDAALKKRPGDSLLLSRKLECMKERDLALDTLTDLAGTVDARDDVLRTLRRLWVQRN